MRPGTPGFIGQRLREAREARGIAPQQLAELLGVRKQSISQYENSQQTPRPEVMEKLPAVLNVKSRFFFRPLTPQDSSTLFWRSMKAASKRARARGRRRQEWLFDVIKFAQTYVEIPAPNLPTLDLPDNPQDITDEIVEGAATQLRRFWKLGDGIISDLVLLLENNGILVSRGELWATELDAFSRWRQGRPFIFLATEKASAVRSRLDAAHELGHLVLHRAVTPEMLEDKAVFDRIEQQAFRFAGAFLLPKNSFVPLIGTPSLELFRALKPTLKISIGAMIRRVTELGLIADPTTLWQKYRRKKWHLAEPLDREIVPERPRLLRHVFELLVSEGVLSKEEIAGRFDIPEKDVEELAGLEPGFLEPRITSVRLLALPTRGQPKGAEPSEQGPRAVLQFPSIRLQGGE